MSGMEKEQTPIFLAGFVRAVVTTTTSTGVSSGWTITVARVPTSMSVRRARKSLHPGVSTTMFKFIKGMVEAYRTNWIPEEEDLALCPYCEDITPEEWALMQVVKSARVVQDFLWGECNGAWGLEEWRRMFRKRAVKIDDIKADNPHAMIELRKRLLQNAALSVALIGLIDKGGKLHEDSPPGFKSNLEEYKDDFLTRQRIAADPDCHICGGAGLVGPDGEACVCIRWKCE